MIVAETQFNYQCVVNLSEHNSIICPPSPVFKREFHVGARFRRLPRNTEILRILRTLRSDGAGHGFEEGFAGVGFELFLVFDRLKVVC